MFKSSWPEFCSPCFYFYFYNEGNPQLLSKCALSASMSTRKVMKASIGGQRRRSPRISAMDSSCKGEDLHQNRRTTRSSRSKRKLDHTAAPAAALPPLSKLPKQVWKGRESQENADHWGVEWRSLKHNQKKHLITNGEESAMPEKRILELLLDTLQRRDTHEIFAQPVDPRQVDDYYEIIKEPMDFGTMRAKLHEGMYKNLQQFEHDVFLIPENAMYFNSSGTAYFRQARAIHDLAKKVFHVLHTDPKNFVSEFSGTRRRSMRRALTQTKVKEVCPLQPPPTSTFRTRIKSTTAMTERLGSEDGRLSNPQIADRRDTYFHKSEEDPLHLSFYSSCQYSLVLMKEGDISYKESLMSFLTGLGPTAQRVAKRKLSGDHQSVAAREFKTFRDFAPAPASCNAFAKASHTVDLTKDEEEAAKLRDVRTEKTDIPNNKVTVLKNRNGAPVVRDLNCSSRPVILALENHHSKSNAAEFKSRIKRSCVASRPAFEEADQQKKKKTLPLISHFTFDLPFLKARLDQMKAVEIGLKGRPPSFGEGGLSIT